MNQSMTYEEFQRRVSSVLLTEKGNCPVTPVVQMLQGDIDDPLEVRLADGGDPGGADVLAQQHTEVGSRHGRRLILFCQIDKRQAGRS